MIAVIKLPLGQQQQQQQRPPQKVFRVVCNVMMRDGLLCEYINSQMI